MSLALEGQLESSTCDIELLPKIFTIDFSLFKFIRHSATPLNLMRVNCLTIKFAGDFVYSARE